MNYSDRWLAWRSGTTKAGADPHVVAENLRRYGTPIEEKWPFDGKTFEEYHQTPPVTLYDEARRDFLEKYDFKHDTVRSNPEDMKEALRFSPLGVSVGFNAIDENGYYFKSHNGPDGHWVTCYGYEEGKYWKIYDTYDETHKKLRWDAKPDLVKRYAIVLRAEKESLLRSLYLQAIEILKRILAIEQAEVVTVPQAPQPEAPKPPKRDLLNEFCQAIQLYEGYEPGTIAYRNNNPGNLRNWHNQDGTKGGFAYFKTYEKGFAALKELVTRAASGKSTVYKPTDSIFQFFSKYAPISDNNDPKKYAAFVAKRLKVAATFPISKLIA